VEASIMHLQLIKFTSAIAGCLLIGAATPALAAAKPAAPKPAASIPAASLIQPADLAALLQSPVAPKPLILQVGFRTMYVQSHISGADYAGPANEEPGLQRLRERVAALPKDAPIVIYCGCCPWNHCPNIGEAFAALQGLGFTRVKVMYIAENFGDDWVNKGYPVAKGS
jgi:thiosulfate/3-mercaptopyruvate sulfurtransferase